MSQEQVPTQVQKPAGLRGFAAMSPEQQREIASKGGRAAHKKGTAHEFTREEAAQAGRKGGEARAQNLMNSMKQQSRVPHHPETRAPEVDQPLTPPDNLQGNII